MVEKKIEEWVKLAIENEDITNYDIVFDGKTGKDDGYLGNIYFVTVNGRTTDRRKKSLNLVIKCSKESNVLRQQIPIKDAFDKEIYIYDSVLKIFENFQKENGTDDYLGFMPHCYVSQITKTSELLVLENLKKQGFDVWDRKVPMTFDHVKLVLQAYAKWHAFSLALKKHKKAIFDKLVEGNINMFSNFFVKTGLIKLTLDVFEQSRNSCISAAQVGILQKLQFSERDANYFLTDLFFEDEASNVILHGDCWNNNFMFKSDECGSRPTGVRILDWQCSGLGSPVMDLSHFIYGCCDTGKYRDIKELLHIYHQSLSDCLGYLGCSSEKVFPYSKLLDHWKQFSRYGILLQPLIIKFELCETDDAPDFAELAEQGKEFLEGFNFKIGDPEEYYRRTRNNFLHYVDNLNF